MTISPIAPFTPAWNNMVRILFKPFDIKKWFVLGFCAFLANCGEGGGGNYGNSGSNSQNKTSFRETIQNVDSWIDANMGLFIGIVVGSVLFFLTIGLLVTWISSRGKFMLLDGIVKNRAAVKEPWAEFKALGNSLFLLRVIVGFISLICLGLIFGIPLALAYPDFQNETFGSGTVSAIIIVLALGIPFTIIGIAFSFFLSGFVVPTMYVRKVRATEGLCTAWQHICRDHLGSALLLFLFMCVLHFGVIFLVVAVTCLTCCVAALPYISSVIFLPVTVFFVCYFLCYIEQFGDDWKFFEVE